MNPDDLLLFDSETLTTPSSVENIGSPDFNLSTVSTEAPPPNGTSEICYITDDAGIILSLDDNHWNTFIGNNAQVPLPQHQRRCQFPDIVGRNLFEFICEVKLQKFFRHIIYMLITGMQTRFVYHWYCDSPECERKMSMVVTKLSAGTGNKLILWRSNIISEKILGTPQNYLGAPAVQVVSPDLLLSRPLRTVCSYCKRILVPWNDINEPEKILKLVQHLDGPAYDPDFLKAGKVVPIIGYRMPTLLID